MMRRVAVIASASGNGKTTVGRQLAAYPTVRLCTPAGVDRFLSAAGEP